MNAPECPVSIRSLRRAAWANRRGISGVMVAEAGRLERKSTAYRERRSVDPIRLLSAHTGHEDVGDRGAEEARGQPGHAGKQLAELAREKRSPVADRATDALLSFRLLTASTVPTRRALPRLTTTLGGGNVRKA